MFILLIQTTSWNQLLTMDFQWLFLENLSILWVLFSDEILILLYVSVIIKTIETYHSVVHLNKDFVMNLAKYSSMIKKWILFIFKSTCRSGKYTLSFVILCCINYMYFLFLQPMHWKIKMVLYITQLYISQIMSQKTLMALLLWSWGKL